MHSVSHTSTRSQDAVRRSTVSSCYGNVSARDSVSSAQYAVFLTGEGVSSSTDWGEWVLITP